MKEEGMLWEILVPTVMGADNKPIRTRYHRVWDSKVREIAGGLTIFQPAKGHWISTDDVLFEERMIPVRIKCTEDQIEQIADMTAKYYQQEAVMYTLISERCVIKHYKKAATLTELAEQAPQLLPDFINGVTEVKVQNEPWNLKIVPPTISIETDAGVVTMQSAPVTGQSVYIQNIGETVLKLTKVGDYDEPQNVCPKCRQEDISNEGPPDDGRLFVTCFDCGFQWHEPSTEPKPIYKHDCDNCVFLGSTNATFAYTDDRICDLYVCCFPSNSKNISTVIARYSDDGPDYQSSSRSYRHDYGELHEAYKRALAAGYVDERKTD